jgi:hypothetical protein
LWCVEGTGWIKGTLEEYEMLTKQEFDDCIAAVEKLKAAAREALPTALEIDNLKHNPYHKTKAESYDREIVIDDNYIIFRGNYGREDFEFTMEGLYLYDEEYIKKEMEKAEEAARKRQKEKIKEIMDKELTLTFQQFGQDKPTKLKGKRADLDDVVKVMGLTEYSIK